MERLVCVHGHFYQPPRDNPWLEAIELQDSAAPYHDWNERITAECYGPNARSRIFDDEGRVAAVVNNYARMSFNVGPTLLAWMEYAQPLVYGAIVRADKESRDRFGGHGSALAQAYNHMILPLANRRDQRTQVLWGIADFRHRFGREPEGMWLPETAVNVETLDVLAEAGIAFTVLAPHQARRVRVKGRRWQDVGDAGVDTGVSYAVRLPSGRSITVLFYDGPLSRGVAFEGLLNDGAAFAERLLGAFPDVDDEEPRLSHIATDGESYGHHHRRGDMALAFALDRIDHDETARLTNYGEFLALRPPAHEAEVADDTSWSCSHGVERWRTDCGCNTGRGWHQRWRTPLREALDWLRDRVTPTFEAHGGKLLTDPWAARDDYVEVVLDRTPSRVGAFLARHSAHDLDEEERSRALKLLELQRHAMLMYTSCGWFFDELSGIETVQVLQYAGRAVQLARELFDEDLEGEFLERLEGAESNVPELGNGRQVYERHVRPAMVDLTKVGAHYAAMSLFEEPPTDDPEAAEAARVYCYLVDSEDHRVHEAGRTRLALGRVRVTSEVTREWATVSYGALHFGDHNLNAAARAFLGDDAYAAMTAEVAEAFEAGDLPEVVRRLDRHFGGSPYSLRSLFRDEQRKVLDVILGSWLDEALTTERQLHEHQGALIRFLAGMGVPLPEPFRANAEVVVDAALLEQFESDGCDPEVVRSLLVDTADWGLHLDVERLAFAFARTVAGVALQLRQRAQSGELLQRLDELVDLAHSLPWEVDLWEAQGAYFEVVQDVYAATSERGDADAAARAERMRALADKLRVRLP